MITLRPNQQTAVEDIRAAYRAGKRAPLLVAPCGFGKTVIFSYIAANAVKLGNSVMILVHRQELIDQVEETLRAFDCRFSTIAPGAYTNYQSKIQVASVQSVTRRLERIAPPALMVVDEAHHATATSWRKIFNSFPRSRLLGVTATPVRLSGEGLSPPFDALIHGPTTSALTLSGHLAPARVFAPELVDTSSLHSRMGDYVKGEVEALVDKPSITGNCIEHYKRLAPDKRAVAFTVSVEHAHHVAQEFRSHNIKAVAIDGNTDKHVRRGIIKDFARGAIQVLTSCDLISEGFDCPGIEVGISLRPTQSLGLWLQQVGRCIRTAPGKREAIILDHAGNTLRHGLPTDDREWSLSGIPKRSGKKSDADSSVSIRVCPKCFAAQLSSALHCIQCGIAFESKGRKIEELKGELRELTPDQLAERRHRMKARMEQGRLDMAGLVELGRMKGYRDPEKWAAYVVAGRNKKRLA